MNDECKRCLRHTAHDGHCYGKSGVTPCLAFQEDSKGYAIYKELELPVPFGLEIPKANELCDYYMIGDIDKPIKILSIKEVRWNVNKYGINEGVILKAQVQYWSHENGTITYKPKLKVIKGGGGYSE